MPCSHPPALSGAVPWPARGSALRAGPARFRPHRKRHARAAARGRRAAPLPGSCVPEAAAAGAGLTEVTRMRSRGGAAAPCRGARGGGRSCEYGRARGSASQGRPARYGPAAPARRDLWAETGGRGRRRPRWNWREAAGNASSCSFLFPPFLYYPYFAVSFLSRSIPSFSCSFSSSLPFFPFPLPVPGGAERLRAVPAPPACGVVSGLTPLEFWLSFGCVEFWSSFGCVEFWSNFGCVEFWLC